MPIPEKTRPATPRETELEHHNQVLEYQLTELMGCLDEFEAMPCKSLEQRLISQGHRCRLRLKNIGIDL